MNKMPIKYREAIFAEPDNTFVGWNYWGWIDGEWQEIESNAPENSYPFIGLKDENGVEAYEGDIVTAGDNYPSVIEWNQKDEMIEGTGFCLHEYYPRRGRYAEKHDRYHTLTYQTTGLGKIIGNIVESPKLLRKVRNDLKW